MKRWIVLFGGGKDHRVFGSFATEDCEYLKLYDRIEDAREQKHVIRSKWPYLNAWVVELDFDPQPDPNTTRRHKEERNVK